MSDVKSYLLDEYKEYERSIYPSGVHPNQSEECEQAWVMGAFMALNWLIQAMEKNDDNLEQEVHNMYKFFHDYKEQKLKAMMTRKTQG